MKIADTIIIINSSNRVGKVVTPNLFPDDSMEWFIAVPEEQQDEYVAKFGQRRITTIPAEVPKFLPSQRQWVMEHFTNHGWKYIWLMDDDLCFFTRNEENLLRKSTTEEIEAMFVEMRKHLDEVSMVGISTRLGNNRITSDYDEINRVTRCYAMSTEVFSSINGLFMPFEPFTAEDFNITLQFLQNGYKNRILHTYAQEDVGGSNAEGGCSLYRTSEVQKKTSFWLAETYPSVKVKGKYCKGSWGLQELKDGRNYRVDVIVQWKQAYKPKKEKAKMNFSFLKKE